MDDASPEKQAERVEALRLQYEAALKQLAAANPCSPLLSRKLTFGAASPATSTAKSEEGKRDVPTAVKAGSPASALPPVSVPQPKALPVQPPPAKPVAPKAEEPPAPELSEQHAAVEAAVDMECKDSRVYALFCMILFGMEYNMRASYCMLSYAWRSCRPMRSTCG